jgi:hypothetical protein
MDELVKAVELLCFIVSLVLVGIGVGIWSDSIDQVPHCGRCGERVYDCDCIPEDLDN